MMTDNSTEPLLDQAAARRLTDELRKSLTISWNLLVEAYQRRAWAALGYESWDAYTDAELGETRLRLPREERREVVASMTDAGLSTRAISSALGVNRETVMKDRQVVGNQPRKPEPVSGEIVENRQATTNARHPSANVTAVREWHAQQVAAAREVEELGEATRNAVTGTDGKTYTVQPPAPPKQRRRPLPDQYRDVVRELTRVTERLQRLHADDRFAANREALQHWRHDVDRAAEIVFTSVGELLRDLAIPQPPKYGPRRKHLQVLQAMTTALSGITTAADEITELDSSVTKDEAAQLLRDLSQQIRSLSRIKNLLEGR